jgi:phage-related protein
VVPDALSSAIGDTIYVLDCFTKNTRKTDSNTLNKARARLSLVRIALKESSKDVKHKRIE